MRKASLSEKEVYEVRNLYMGGMNLKDISKKLNVSYDVIFKVINKKGIYRRIIWIYCELIRKVCSLKIE